MKFQITLKDPDGVWSSLEEAFGDANNLPPDAEAVIDEFIEYNEYVTIELDTETGEARVVPV